MFCVVLGLGFFILFPPLPSEVHVLGMALLYSDDIEWKVNLTLCDTVLSEGNAPVSRSSLVVSAYCSAKINSFCIFSTHEVIQLLTPELSH